MLETSLQRKNKISLEDYNYRQDIENRMLMGQFSSTDLEVLEEILYSSIEIPIRKLVKSLQLKETELMPILQKLSKTGLFGFEDETIIIDKEMRKYFESQILKFDPEAKPGMEFLQSLMRKVPIHVLPLWYSIPRTSNNIFDSLIEKYLLTPQIFHRYLLELNFSDPKLSAIIQDVYSAPNFQVYGKDLIEKYALTHEQFEEYLLSLEFHLVCCLSYTKVDEIWQETVAPFYEWREYLTFLRDTAPPSISTTEKIQRFRPQDFSFIQDSSCILNMLKKQPLPFVKETQTALTLMASKLEGIKEEDFPYLNRILAKLRMLKLIDLVDGRLYALEAANDWLDMRLENRALYLYRHPLNHLDSDKLPAHLCTERHVREAEKSVLRVLHSGWVYFDDFLRGVTVPLGEESIIMLKRQGKTWKYTLPSYGNEERLLLRSTVLEWLFEMGITAVGTHAGRDCFSVTPFGQSLFGR